MPEPIACSVCGLAFAPHGGRHRVYCRRCTARAEREAAMVRRVDCKECGKKFSATNRMVRYCSRECSTAYSLRRNREYHQRCMADPEKRAIMSARKRASEARRRAMAGGGGGGRQADRRRPPRTASRGPQACRLCGRDIGPSGGRAAAGAVDGYCRRCAARADRDLARARRVDCKECGKRFSASHRGACYCSDECRTEGRRRRGREHARKRALDPEKRAMASVRARASIAKRKAREAAERRDKQGERGA